MGNTYGTWLPGDPKGFRTLHHREHVEGDYRFPPPPGMYDQRWETAKRNMKRPAVFFARQLRPIICRIMADALRDHYNVELVELSIGGMHFHLLARFTPVGVDPYHHLQSMGIQLTHQRRTAQHASRRRMSAYDHDPAPRRILGMVRSWTTRRLKQLGHFVDHPGGLWAQRPKILPVTSRSHQLASVQYIRRHDTQGAAVLSLLDQQ